MGLDRVLNRATLSNYPDMDLNGVLGMLFQGIDRAETISSYLASKFYPPIKLSYYPRARKNIAREPQH